MRKIDVHRITRISRPTIDKAVNGELKDEILAGKIMELLSLESNYLEGIFLDKRFSDCMEVVIKKAPSTAEGVELRKFAVLAQHTAINLRNRKQTETEE